MSTFEPIAENVKDFIQIAPDKLILRKGIEIDNHELVILNYSTNQEIQITEKAEFQLQELNFEKNIIWLNKWEDGSIFFDIDNLKIQETPLLIKRFIDSKVALCVKREERKKHFVLFDFEQSKTLTEIEGSSTLFEINNDLLFFLPFEGLKRYKVECFNLRTGEHHWSYTLPNLEENDRRKIQKLFGVIEENVIIGINNSTLVYLDLLTGQETASWKTDLSGFNTAHLIGNKIVNCGSTKFYEIDLKSKEISTGKVDNLIVGRSIPEHKNQNEMIFYAQEFDPNSNFNIVGCLNMIEGTISWQDTLKIDKSDNLGVIKQFDDSLFVLSGQGNLFMKKLA